MELFRYTAERFTFAPTRKSHRIDPRVTTQRTSRPAQARLQPASMGSGFPPEVQEVIHRIQPLE